MGDVFHNTTTTTTATAAGAGATGQAYVYVQGFTHGTERRALLINKQGAPTTVLLEGASSARVVDASTHQGPPRDEAGLNGSITLDAFATAVVRVTG